MKRLIGLLFFISSSCFGFAETPTESSYKDWKIGGKIHFEEQSSVDYIGTLEINELTRATIKDFFDIKSDSCAHNAKVLIKKENDKAVIRHREEKSKPGIGEEMHATLIYTSKRVDDEHDTLLDIYDNLMEIDEDLPSEQPPTVEQVANAYQKIIKPDWKLLISDVEFISGKTGSGIIAKLRFNGQKELLNEKGKPISSGYLHLTLAMVDPSMFSESEKINCAVLELKEKLSGKMIKIGNRHGQADLEFGISGSADRVRPSLVQAQDNERAVPNHTKNVPNRVKLNVVYIPQNDAKSCATTSIAMAISYYENLNETPLDKETVWQISGTDEHTVYKYGNDMEGLKRIADYYGYKSEYVEHMKITDIENLISKGIPVMLNIGDEVGTHALLVIGYDKNKMILYVNDPAYRHNKVIEYSDLETSWSAHLSSPKGKSQRSGFIVYPKNHEFEK